MPARAAFHRAGIVCGGDRNPDRGILVLAVLARRADQRWRRVAPAAGRDGRRHGADFRIGAGAAGRRRVHSQWMRSVTAPSATTSFVQFLCTPFGEGAIGSGSGRWTFDLWITAPLILSLALYGIGTSARWRRARWRRGIRPWQVGCFAAGWLMLGVALVSPIHHWGTELFWVHMVEHELVMAVAVPLIALAQPGWALIWALPMAFRRRIGSAIRSYWLRAAWGALIRPGGATILHGAAIWAWHVPVIFEAAVVSLALHRLQHLSFLVSGLLFWSALVGCRNAGVAAAALFATMLHTRILGALVALGARVL